MSKKGFTLVELLVVIVIIGILAAAAISVFGGGTDKAKLNTMKSDVSAMHSAGTLALADKGWEDNRLVKTLAEQGYLSEVPNNPFLGASVDTYGYGYAQSKVVDTANNATTTNPVIYSVGFDSDYNPYGKGADVGIAINSIGTMTGATQGTFWMGTDPTI